MSRISEGAGLGQVPLLYDPKWEAEVSEVLARKWVDLFRQRGLAISLEKEDGLYWIQMEEEKVESKVVHTGKGSEE